MDKKTLAFITGSVDGFLSRYGCRVVECADGETSLERPSGDVFGHIDGYGRVIVEGVILDGLRLVLDGDGWDVVRMAATYKETAG